MNSLAATVVASRDFSALYKLGEMIHLNLDVKYSHSSFDILFFKNKIQSITHKTKYETTFFKNDYGTHHTQKFI
jgi:hypothetical protein